MSPAGLVTVTGLVGSSAWREPAPVPFDEARADLNVSALGEMPRTP
jgi:hypothetical protein